MSEIRRQLRRLEWPTLAVLAGCYGFWIALILVSGWVPWPLIAVGLTFTAALHSSLQHETVHNHPTPWPLVNEALVFPALWMVMPWRRYRDSHIAHHRTGRLTDPLEDPESYYLDTTAWSRCPTAIKGMLALQSTLPGRLLLGPPIAVGRLVLGDIAKHRAGDRSIAPAWGLHAIAVAPVLIVLIQAGVPIWLYVLTVVWPATSLLLLRSFAEHRPASSQAQRSVLVESGPLLSLIYLNNNLHALHHQRPGLPWYRLPQIFRRNRETLISGNGGYHYRGYGDVLRRHLFDSPRAPLHPNPANEAR